MPTPKEVLSLDEFGNYRTIRQLAVAFVLFGLLGLLAALSMFTDGAVKLPPQESGSLIPILVASVAVCNLICGVATWLGSRKLAMVMYAFAVPQLLVFPLGTAMSYTLLKGLSRYMESVDLIRASRVDSRS